MDVLKPINWVDQNAHFWSCFFLTLSTNGYGAHVVALWAISREYYQTKSKMKDAAREYDLQKNVKFMSVIKFMWAQGDFWKRDLKFSYAGIVAALAIIIPLNLWVF